MPRSVAGAYVCDPVHPAGVEPANMLGYSMWYEFVTPVPLIMHTNSHRDKIKSKRIYLSSFSCLYIMPD